MVAVIESFAKSPRTSNRRHHRHSQQMDSSRSSIATDNSEATETGTIFRRKSFMKKRNYWIWGTYYVQRVMVFKVGEVILLHFTAVTSEIQCS